MFDRPSTNIEREQVGFVAWASDYPSAWDFLTPLSCSSWSQFCDPSIDRQAAKALSEEPTNPQEANLAWTRIDRRLVDEAAWLPLLTPKWIDFVSKRVGNYQYNPERGMLIDQVWVR
jgi:peptide/nickel transport system substrate-binding protein